MKKVENRSTTLPAVLKEYVPEYDPTSSLKGRVTKDENQPVKKSTQDEGGKRNSSSYQCHHQDKEQQNKSQTRSASAKSKRKKVDVGQEKVNDDERLECIPRNKILEKTLKKYEDLSQKWDQAKAEVRQDDYEQLKRKIELQQELIRRQDILAEQRKTQLQQEVQQKKDEDKKKRRELQASLEEKCKKSLEEDKKSVRQEKRRKSKSVLVQSPELERRSSAGNVFQKSGSPGTGRSIVSPGTRNRGFQSSLPPMSRTPSNPDIGDSLPGTPMSEKEMLEWYQVQLYQKFGPDADYFLHPKIEQKTTKPIHPKLHKHGDVNPLTVLWKRMQDTKENNPEFKGRAGAEKLLGILRKESMVRLYKEDLKIPREYKEAYNALVRFHLGKYNVNLRRIFAADNDDVAEIARLSDQSVMKRARHQRHKTELMYRASVNNQDRTNILNIENPVDALNTEQDQGVGKYLPSWLDDSSEVSEEDYVKWLRGRESERDLTFDVIVEEGEIKDNFKENVKPESRGLDDELVLLMSRKRHKKPKHNLKFLTVEDTQYKGSFSGKFREDHDIPKPFNEAKAPDYKSHSVLGMRTSSDDLPSCKSAPIPEKHRKYYTSYVSNWQPLSMNALIEYKKKMETEGDGDFNQGRAKMWKTKIEA